MQNAQKAAHTLTIENRTGAVITGVEDVECFSGDMAVITTGMGAITLTGGDLKVASLDLALGRVALTGRIDALEYGAARKGGLFSRLFK